jgi:hypothetical protein
MRVAVGLQGVSKLIVSLVATLSHTNPSHTDELCALIVELLDEHKPSAASASASASHLVGALSGGARAQFHSHSELSEGLGPICHFLQAVINQPNLNSASASASAAASVAASKLRAIQALYSLALARASVTDLLQVVQLLLSHPQLSLSVYDLMVLHAFERAASTEVWADSVFASESEAVGFALSGVDVKQSQAQVPALRAAVFIMAQIHRISRAVCALVPEHLHFSNTKDTNPNLYPIFFHPCAIELTPQAVMGCTQLLQHIASSAAAQADPKAVAFVALVTLHVLKVHVFQDSLVSITDADGLTLSAADRARVQTTLCRLSQQPLFPAAAATTGSAGSAGAAEAKLSAPLGAANEAAEAVRREAELVFAFGFPFVCPSARLMAAHLAPVLNHRSAVIESGACTCACAVHSLSLFVR